MTELIQDKISIDSMTPSAALTILKKGNARFINNLRINRDYLERLTEVKDEQQPFAAILSCMDSRAPVETIFDQGLGDVFSVRIAGNVITDNILGCLEFATALAGSKLIVVMGHTNCGAIKGACDHLQPENMTNLGNLLNKILPAVDLEDTITEERNSGNKKFVDRVAAINVKYSVKQLLEQSPTIKELTDTGRIGIVPAMFDIATGKVNFFEDEAIIN